MAKFGEQEHYITQLVVANVELQQRLDDLLEACREVSSFAVSWQPLTPGDISVLRKAIAKAEAVAVSPADREARDDASGAETVSDGENKELIDPFSR